MGVLNGKMTQNTLQGSLSIAFQTENERTLQSRNSTFRYIFGLVCINRLHHSRFYNKNINHPEALTRAKWTNTSCVPSVR